MNTYQEKLLEAKTILGSYAKLAKVCGLSGKAVMKWVIAGKPPRTEYTGETNYAELISESVNGLVSKDDLIPSVDRVSTVDQHERRSRDRRAGIDHKSLMNHD